MFNPFASEINLFPDSREALRRRIANSLRLPMAFVPGWMLNLLGAVNGAPGRLYTFVAVKPHG